jgi:methyl coenzyme M reductase subunit D
VILTENINEEIPIVYKNVGIELSNGELVRRKATGKDYIKYLSLDEKLKNRLEKQNRLDYRLYEYFKNLSSL